MYFFNLYFPFKNEYLKSREKLFMQPVMHWWKTTPIKTSVSRQHGAQLRLPLKPLQHHNTMLLWILRGPLRWASIMLRCGNLSGNRCYFFQSGQCGIYSGRNFREKDFLFLSNLMEYDRRDRFPFDCEPNGIQFGSKLTWKLSPRFFIQFVRIIFFWMYKYK